MKILLAEDDVMLHQLYLDVLKSAGYEVVDVVDGEAAYRHMLVGGYDLVLLDHLMPAMTGIEVIEKLKNTPDAKPNKKVIFMTNVDDPEKLKDITSISDGYLLKSTMTPDQFLQKVKEYLV